MRLVRDSKEEQCSGHSLLPNLCRTSPSHGSNDHVWRRGVSRRPWLILHQNRASFNLPVACVEVPTQSIMINCKRLSVMMSCVVGSEILREADRGDRRATMQHKTDQKQLLPKPSCSQWWKAFLQYKCSLSVRQAVYQPPQPGILPINSSR
jgi:hypothetical protein